MKEKIKKSIIITIIAAVIFILFYEMFIEIGIKQGIGFIELQNHENRSDLLMFISIVITTIINYNVYKLSKRIHQQNNIEKDRNKYESACIVYDYLNEVISYTKKVVFKDKEDYHILEYNKEFMKSVYGISKDILDEQDIELIRKIDQSIRNYLKRDKSGIAKKLIIKWVYKNIFDINMRIEEIEELNNIVDTDLLLSPQLILILSKLRNSLNYNYCKNIEYGILSLKIENKNNKIIVKKVYTEEFYINNGTGEVRLYEPIFYSSEKLYHDGGMIYKGKIKEYLPNGSGTYYYYKSNPEKGIYVNSNDLVDRTAVRLKRILQKEKIDTGINLTVVGKFNDGKITNGYIEFEDKSLKKIKIEENDYSSNCE